ncbi:hypothetical protein K490DRAFT_67938 [Saccharata proteae CBS 121410]|uniref:Uncharacterized protein n=1 Tax=Saccharata proteae CBS 121410 TaxID=1314787 RepID=A0A9P4HRV0_9PEZI|nr:hypothetical protein K490DRAFT_67938 [Saccharata proteae CBS 121410]
MSQNGALEIPTKSHAATHPINLSTAQLDLPSNLQDRSLKLRGQSQAFATMNSPSEAGSDAEEFPGAQAWDTDGDGFSDADLDVEGTGFYFPPATEEDADPMYVDKEDARDEAPAAKAIPARQHLRHQNFSHIGGMKFEDWVAKGRTHWEAVKASITPQNANAVRCIAMSHWNTLEDFEWLENQRLPKLQELDLSDISDFYLRDHDNGYTWEQLRNTIPTVLSTVEIVWVRNWTSAAQHARVRMRYPQTEPLFVREEMFCMPESRGGRESRSDITQMLTACTRLRYLKIIGHWRRTLDFWNVGQRYTDETLKKQGTNTSHERVCELVRGINTCLRETPLQHVHLYQSYFSPVLIKALAKLNKNIHLRVSLNGFFACHHSWRFHLPQDEHHAKFMTVEDQDIVPLSGLSSWYTAEEHECEKQSGTPHLEWHDEDTNFYENPLSISTFLVQLFDIDQANPNLTLSRFDDQNHPISFFNFIDLKSNYMGLFGRDGNTGRNLPDGTKYPWSQKTAMQTINWLRMKMNWEPAFSIDPFISPDFPQNLLRDEVLDAARKDGRTLDKARRIITHKFMKKRILKVLLTLTTTQIEKNRHPYTIHLWIGDRPDQKPAAYWGSLTRKEWQGWQKPEESDCWKPTDIAIGQYLSPLVEVLTIDYPDWTPHLRPEQSVFITKCTRGVIEHQLPLPREPIPANRETATKLLKREAGGWQRFWHHYALMFKNLWRLDVTMPQNFDDVYSWRLARLLYGKKWEGPAIYPDKKGDWTVFVTRSWERSTRGEMKFSSKDWQESEEKFVDNDEEGIMLDASIDDAGEEMHMKVSQHPWVPLLDETAWEWKPKKKTKKVGEPGSQSIDEDTADRDDLFEDKEDSRGIDVVSDCSSPGQETPEHNISAKHSEDIPSTQSPTAPIPSTDLSTSEIPIVPPRTEFTVTPETPAEFVPAVSSPAISSPTLPAPAVPTQSEETTLQVASAAPSPPTQPTITTLSQFEPQIDTAATKFEEDIADVEDMQPRSPTKSPRKSVRTAPVPAPVAVEPQTNSAATPAPAPARNPLVQYLIEGLRLPKGKSWDDIVESTDGPSKKAQSSEKPKRRNLRSSGPPEQVNLASPTVERKGGDGGEKEGAGKGKKRKRMTEKERLRIEMEGWMGEKRRKA